MVDEKLNKGFTDSFLCRKEGMYRLIGLSLLLLSFSCSLFQRGSFRNPANQTTEDYLQKYEEESARFVLRYEPKKYGDFNSLIRDREELYRLMGRIDLNHYDLIPSRLTGDEIVYRNLFDLSRVKQVDFNTWLEMKEDIVETYLKGDYVFRKGLFYYTLSGLKLVGTEINHWTFFKANNFNPHYERKRLILDVFNRNTIHRFKDGTALILPSGHQVFKENFNYIMKDFKSQVGPDIEISPFDLMNYDSKKLFPEINGYQVYENQKYQSFLHGETLFDPNYACKTKFYFRSLSRRKEAKIFMDTLLSHKSRLMRELELTNNEYDELMVLSLGILAVESKMGTSLKYKIKEDLRIGELNLGQFGIKLLKRIKGRSDENSRGLTQIKDIGPLLEDSSYSYLKEADLDNPQNAAIATMFVLKEKLGYLRHFSSRHTNITEDNWADYLYYFYQGSSSQITKGLATPPLNLRIQKILTIKENSMIFRDCR